MKKFYSILISIMCSFFVGCASIASGTNQPISVTTTPVTGANCTLMNKEGTWYANNNPASVIVHKSVGDLKIDCKKEKYATGTKTVKSKIKPMILGNAIFGGAIGAAVDRMNGVAFEYPQTVDVAMQPNNG